MKIDHRSKSTLSVLFLGKKNDENCAKALHFCQMKFECVKIFLGTWGDPFPKSINTWNGDLIISYLSRWVIPDSVLKKARKAAINFHPASPEYPGIGCNNFALYENASEYGVTCHHMLAHVDTGDIIAVKRFTVFPDDTVASLLHRTYEYQFELFVEVIDILVEGKTLPSSKEQWARKSFTRAQLNDLARITPAMSKEEISRRIRATQFGAFKPKIILHGYVFELIPIKKEG